MSDWGREGGREGGRDSQVGWLPRACSWRGMFGAVVLACVCPEATETSHPLSAHVPPVDGLRGGGKGSDQIFLPIHTEH